ncbi:MAG: AAA family ATPase, partial [Solirubrobacteraceae bacterium]
MARMMPAPRWEDLACNYSAHTLESLASLMGWSSGPPPGGRLLLWHGVPGTGKTTAIRALARQWRSWAEFEF